MTGEPPDIITVYALLAEIQPLAPLGGWAPVGGRVQQLLDALRGEGGVTRREVNQLRAWAGRWSMLHPKVQAFYVRHAPSEGKHLDIVRVALWRVLRGGPPLEDWMYGRLYEIWAIDHGDRPRGIEIAPTKISSIRVFN